MSVKMYLELIEKDAQETIQIINTITHMQRIELRERLESWGCAKIVQNLYYDYQTQKWIGL